MSVELGDMQDIVAFNNIKPISSPDPEKNTKGYREIVLGIADKDEQDIYLKLRDEKHTWNNLYLGRSRTFKIGQSQKHWNVVVPIVPRCYTTPGREPAHADHPRKGWIYIIRKCRTPEGQTVVELWRELQSDGLGNFSDVQLKYQRDRDHRPATGQPGFRIIVPYRIDNQVHELWIAYSEVPWSWARVDQMKKDADLREKRMHKLDLSGCLDNFSNCEPAPAEDGDRSDDPENAPVKDVSGKALIHRLDLATDDNSKHLPEDFKDPIPVVYLDDPVGIARELAARYQLQWKDMKDCVSGLRGIPNLMAEFISGGGSSDIAGSPQRWFEAAALANRYFYSKISKEVPLGVKDKHAYKKRLTEIEEQFLKYRNRLDKPAIEQALRKSQRAEIRDKLVRAREKLVAFLQTELALPPDKKEQTRANEEMKKEQDPPLVRALDDYFTLTPLSGRDRKQNRTGQSDPVWRDNYADGWQAVYDITAGLAKHEYSLDADLEANPPDGWQWRRDNPAFDLMLKLADPQGGSPLHSRLFPKPSAIDPLKCDAAPDKDNAAAFNKQHLDHLEAMIRRDPDVIRGIALFGSNFSELMAMRDKNDSDYEEHLDRARHSLLRLVDSVFGLQLEQTEVTLEELVARQKQPAEAAHSGGVKFLDALGKTIGFASKTIDTVNKIPESAGPGKSPLARTRARVVTAANPSRTLNLLRDLGDNKIVTSSLAGFLGLLEIYNFTQTLRAYAGNKNEDRQWKLFAPLAAGFLKLPATVHGLKESILAKGEKTTTAAAQGPRRALEVLSADDVVKAGKSVTLFKALGIVGDLIDMGVTLSSFTENLAQHDDAAIADAIGFTGAALSLISTAFSVPVLGWIFGLVGIAAWLAKAFLFTEDTPVEIWLANGPFVRGKEYHEHFAYKRDTTVVKTKDANGNWEDTACTVHRFDDFEFLVDSDGTLVNAKQRMYHGQQYASRYASTFNIASDGAVYIGDMASGTRVATIGQPFSMHPKLQPKVKAKTEQTVKAKVINAQGRPVEKVCTVHSYRNFEFLVDGDGNLAATRNRTGHAPFYVGAGGSVYVDARRFRDISKDTYISTIGKPFNEETILKLEKIAHEKLWFDPHQAYLALADAIYRPRVTLTETEIKVGFGYRKAVDLKVQLPFYIPSKSQLYIDFKQKRRKELMEHISPDPESIKDLKSGPEQYEITRAISPGTARTFIAKVRLDLYGDGNVELPHDPQLCGSDIETEINENTVKGVQDIAETKWIVLDKTIVDSVDIFTMG